MIRVDYGYSSKGIHGRTDHEASKEFATVDEARSWAWSYVAPGGNHGMVDVDSHIVEVVYDVARVKWLYDATWSSVYGEPSSARAWVEFETMEVMW